VAELWAGGGLSTRGPVTRFSVPLKGISKIAFSVDSGSSRPCRGNESPLLGDLGISIFRGASKLSGG